MVVRGSRRAYKYYQKNYSNPDKLTRSERDKQATLRQLDRLKEDAMSEEYHQSIVNLAGR